MKRMKIYSLFGLFLFLLPTVAFAQKAERKNVKEGNKMYTNEQYTESEIAFRKSLEVNPTSFEGTYNLGNALYKQEKYPEAAEQYMQLVDQGQRLINDDPKNMEKMAQVFHNLGNIGMQNKEYAQSIEAYKQSLRLNPTDDETRYNLALAQKLLEDQEGEGGGDDDQENEDEQDDQQDQQQDQNQDQNQDQDQQDQKEDKTQEQEQDQQEQMSRDNAQQLLDAFLQDEKDTQEKVQKAQQQQQERRRTEKEW